MSLRISAATPDFGDLGILRSRHCVWPSEVEESDRAHKTMNEIAATMRRLRVKRAQYFDDGRMQPRQLHGLV